MTRGLVIDHNVRDNVRQQTHPQCNEHVKGIFAGGVYSYPHGPHDRSMLHCYLLRYYGTDKEIITGVLSKHNGMN